MVLRKAEEHNVEMLVVVALSVQPCLRTSGKVLYCTGKAGHLSTPKAKSERNDYLTVCPLKQLYFTESCFRNSKSKVERQAASIGQIYSDESSRSA